MKPRRPSDRELRAAWNRHYPSDPVTSPEWQNLDAGRRAWWRRFFLRDLENHDRRYEVDAPFVSRRQAKREEIAWRNFRRSEPFTCGTFVLGEGVDVPFPFNLGEGRGAS